MAIQIKTANPTTNIMMTEFLHQGESFSKGVFLSAVVFSFI